MRGSDAVASKPHELLPYPRRLPVAIISELRWTILGWTAGIIALAALDTASIKTVAENLGKSEVLNTYLASLGGGRQFVLGFLNFAVFVLGATLVATLVINVIGNFAADQEERRVEFEMAQPITTLDVQVARCIALVVATVVPALALLLTVVVTAKIAGIDLAGTHLWSATLMVLPLALAVGMIGVAMLPRFNRQAVMVQSAIVGISFVVTILGGVSGLNLPAWLTHLTLIQAYGSPAVHGVDAGGLTILVAIVAGGVAATVAQARAEMSSG